MNCGWPGSSVHGISQARILEWGPYLSLGGLFNPEIKPHLLHLLHCRWILYHWATREAHRLLYIEWINKISLFSPGNYNQYPVINIMEKNIYIYKCIYTHTHTHTHTHTRRTQHPLQYSRLENPMDRAAWQAAVLGVTWSVYAWHDLVHTHIYTHV